MDVSKHHIFNVGIIYAYARTRQNCPIQPQSSTFVWHLRLTLMASFLIQTWQMRCFLTSTWDLDVKRHLIYHVREFMHVLEPLKDALFGHSIRPPILPLEASNLAQILQMRCSLAYTWILAFKIHLILHIWTMSESWRACPRCIHAPVYSYLLYLWWLWMPHILVYFHMWDHF
jgi:hypothetical protein